jgi:hypothetical protein
MEFGDEGQSLARLTRAVDAARECGFAAVSANDHFCFRPRGWTARRHWPPWSTGPAGCSWRQACRLSPFAAPCLWRRRLPRLICCPRGESSQGWDPDRPSVTTRRSACPLRSAGSASTKPPQSSERSCEATRHPSLAATTRCRRRSWRRLHSAASRSGSGAGAQGRASAVSLASATGGSHPPTTRRPRASRPRRSPCRTSFAPGAGIPTPSPTHW